MPRILWEETPNTGHFAQSLFKINIEIVEKQVHCLLIEQNHSVATFTGLVLMFENYSSMGE